MTDFGGLIRQLHAGGVRFVLVGGFAGTVLKRAAGRPRDLEAIAELEVLLEERRRAGER